MSLLRIDYFLQWRAKLWAQKKPKQIVSALVAGTGLEPMTFGL